MPKIKTHKSTAKRVKKRGSGGLKRQKAFGTHYLGKRSTKRCRELRKNIAVSAADEAKVKRALRMA